ncbi:unnamed protein product [Prunus armeniaca]
MINNLSSRVLDFKGVKVVVSEDKIYKSEVKTRDDGESVIGSMATKDILLTKVVIEWTPRWVELDTRVEEYGDQQQTHKGVLLDVEPSSQARFGPKESI